MSNLTKNEVMSKVTLMMMKIGTTGCGESEGYILCGMNMRLWEIVRVILVESDLAVVSAGNFMTLTTTGASMLAQSTEEADAAKAV